MRIVILTAIYGRHDVFLIWRRVIEAMGVPIVVVGSEGRKSRKICKGLDYLEYPNSPLSDKWIAGLKHLHKRYKYDYVLILGSDDLLCDKYIDFFQSYLDVDLVGRLDSYQYNLLTKECSYFPGYENDRKGETVGAGRFISNRVISQFNGEIWHPGLLYKLDFSMMQILQGVSCRALKIANYDVLGLGLKSYYGMNDFANNEPCKGNVLEYFDEETAKQILHYKKP